MTMNSDGGVTVWWIDDDHAELNGARQSEATALMTQAGDGLELIAIHPAEFEEHVTNLTNEAVPDLLLIDFRLGGLAHPEKPTPFFARDGVTLRGAAIGIDELRHSPAYLVSGVIKEAQIGSLDENFDWVLSHRQLIDELRGTFLLEDARDYRRLFAANAVASEAKDKDDTSERLTQSVVELLRPPPASHTALHDLVHHSIGTILRSESKLDSDVLKLAPSRPRAVARWIRSALHRLRGPLIDDLAAATVMGVKLAFFVNTLKPQLDMAAIQYAGVFERTATMTLWREALLHWLLAKSEEIQLSSPASLARSTAEYFKVPDTERAVCRVCKKLWPEAVAFDEDDASVEAAVHWRCSKEATDVDSVFGFDVPRCFSD